MSCSVVARKVLRRRTLHGSVRVCTSWLRVRTPLESVLSQNCFAQVDRTERSLRSALRDQRREEQRAKQGGLIPHQAKVAMAVYILSDYDLVIAGSFALQKNQGQCQQFR